MSLTRVLFFSTHTFEKEFFIKANESTQYKIEFINSKLDLTTAGVAQKGDLICAFVSDNLQKETLEKLKNQGVNKILLRSAGFNHVDILAAKELEFQIARVPAYSPYAIAEHTIAMILTLNRKTHKAYNRVREGNFQIEGLLGFDLNGKTAGIIGAGKIGFIVAKLLNAFGCKVLIHDIQKNSEVEKFATYVSLDELISASKIISLHCPLNKETFHIIDQKRFAQMQKGSMLINTGRGGLIDTKAAIQALKSEKIGYLGLDVYEEEENLFFHDLSEHIIQDDTFSRLLTFPNVLITSHQAFFTHEALTNIAETTIKNAQDLTLGIKCDNLIF